MQWGRWEIHAVELGRFRLDGGAMFGVVPKVIWEKTNPSDEKNRVTLATRSLLIRGAGRNILVDCGIGDRWDSKSAEIFAVDSSSDRITAEFTGAGVAFDDITDVILTHLHFDHVSGATRTGRNGATEFTFPNARYWIHDRQISHALQPTARDRASYIPILISPVLDSGRVEKVTGGGELTAGIHLMEMAGHTPGHLLVKVDGGERSLLVCSDLIPTASHIPVPYVMAYDLQPLVTIREKTQLLEQALAERSVLFFIHDPELAACTVGTEKGKYCRGENVAL